MDISILGIIVEVSSINSWEATGTAESKGIILKIEKYEKFYILNVEIPSALLLLGSYKLGS